MGEKDIGGKYLIDRDPEGWVRWLLHEPDATVTQTLSSEFQFVGRRSDSLLQVMLNGVLFLVLIELQLHYDLAMPLRMLIYCALARQKYSLPVLPIVIYLVEPSPGIAVAENYHTDFKGYITHQDFMVVKMWELNAHETLKQPAPAGLLPYVPLMAGADIDVVKECAQRIRQEPDHEELETILALFAMIKLNVEQVAQIVRWHVTILEKSPIYQEILLKGVQQGLEQGLELGREQELRQNIGRILTRRFGQRESISVTMQLELLSLATLETVFDEALTAPDMAAFRAMLAAAEED